MVDYKKIIDVNLVGKVMVTKYSFPLAISSVSASLLSGLLFFCSSISSSVHPDKASGVIVKLGLTQIMKSKRKRQERILLK